MSTAPIDLPTDPIALEFKRTLGRLQSMRDELRLQIHLGSMDLQREFAGLEDQLFALERQASHAIDAPKAELRDAALRIERVLSKLGSSLLGG